MPSHAAKVQSMQKLLKKNEQRHEAFDLVKQALADASALVAPKEEECFVLDPDASAVARAGTLHQELSVTERPSYVQSFTTANH